MKRASNKQHFFQTKLKHRLSLNDRYNPINRIRITITDTLSPAMVKLFKAWVSHTTVS